MTASLTKLLQKLESHNIEFILVGGMAAVLHGAPVTTQDLDIVHKRSPENIKRIIDLIKEVNGRYRGQPSGRILRPTESALRGTGHNNLMTDLGPIDFLCELDPGQGYDQLAPFAKPMTDSKISINVITLEKLIEIKSRGNRPKDKLIIPILLKLLVHRQGYFDG